MLISLRCSTYVMGSNVNLGLFEVTEATVSRSVSRSSIIFLLNLGAGRTWHGSTGYFYLPYIERFSMVYPLYSFRDTIGKVHTDPLGALRPPSCTGKFKMLQSSCNTCHIVPLIIRSKKVIHMISV